MSQLKHNTFYIAHLQPVFDDKDCITSFLYCSKLKKMVDIHEFVEMNRKPDTLGQRCPVCGGVLRQEIAGVIYKTPERDVTL